MDNTYVFEAPINNEDSQYIRVVLLSRGQVFDLNAEQESTLDLSTSAIEIPPGSFYTENGELYTVCICDLILTCMVYLLYNEQDFSSSNKKYLFTINYTYR